MCQVRLDFVMLLQFSIICTLFQVFLRVTGNFQVRGSIEVIASSTYVPSPRTYLCLSPKKFLHNISESEITSC